MAIKFSLSGKLAPLTAKTKHVLFNTSQQQAFLEDLSTLIDDGVAPNKAVEAISRMSTGIRADVTDDILDAVAQGKRLAEGMRGWFPQHIVELVLAGEEGGTVAQSMTAAAAALATKSEVFSSFLASLTYPLVVLILGLAVTVYINNSVLSQFAAILPIDQWPALGQQVATLANIVQNWWWAWVVVIIGFSVLIRLLLRNYVGKFRKVIDAVPIIKIYRQMTAARFMDTLGLLIANGIVFKRALKILQQQATPYLTWHVVLIDYQLGSGRGNIADVLDTGMIDEEDILRLRIIAESKGFEHALMRQGKHAMSKSVKSLRTLAKIAGGILLALGAALAAFLVLAIYTVGSSLAG